MRLSKVTGSEPEIIVDCRPELRVFPLFSEQREAAEEGLKEDIAPLVEGLLRLPQGLAPIPRVV